MEDIAIMVLPAKSAVPSILSLLSRKSFPNAQKRIEEKQSNPAEDTIHFIESKTAPYHVDISESKLPIIPTSESSLIARSPAVSLKKTESSGVNPRTARVSKAFILTIPNEDFVLTRTEDKKKVVKKDGKKAIKNMYIPTLTLLGTKFEDCRRGMVRDSYGICRTYSY